MMDELPAFRRLTVADKVFNRFFGFLVGLGIGLQHNYLLVVHGRKTGRPYATPVNILEYAGKRYLVAPRGEAQWVRNTRVAGEVLLRKGSTQQTFTTTEMADTDKAAVLKCYLERFRPTVQRYFPVPAGAKEASFEGLAPKYPVFELTAAATR